MCISQNNLYKQHHTMDYLQKSVIYKKSLVYLSKKYLCQLPYQCHQKSPCVIVHKQDSQNS